MWFVEAVGKTFDTVRPAKQKTLREISQRARDLTESQPLRYWSMLGKARSTQVEAPVSGSQIVVVSSSSTNNFETRVFETSSNGEKDISDVVVNPIPVSERFGITVRHLVGKTDRRLVLVGSERTAKRILAQMSEAPRR